MEAGDWNIPLQILVHEWAKLRWGVYEEYGYPGDEKFPMFYLQTTWGPNGQVCCKLTSSDNQFPFFQGGCFEA